MSSFVIELKSFGISFGGRTILSAIDLNICAQGITVILGPSGTGKSTLLRTLAGLNNHNPQVRTWGVILYQGQPLTLNDPHPALVLQKIGHMISSVQECLLSGLPERNRWTKSQQLDLLITHCHHFDQPWLISLFQQPVIQLNSYQQRILLILRETLSKPALLMLDEPTAGLHEEDAQRMCTFIRRLAAQQPILMVSHHLEQSQHLADDVILLASGHVQEHADVQTFFTSPQSESAQIYLRTGSCPESSQDTLVSDELATPEHLEAPIVVVHNPPSSPPSHAAQIFADPQANSHFMGPRGFVWLIRGRIAGTPWPGIVNDLHQDLDSLKHVGITHLLSLTQTAFPESLAQSVGMTVSHFPIVDMRVPTLTDAYQLCQEIDQRLLSGAKIALHCKAGLGRTGTMLAVYWIWNQNGQISAQQAIQHIRALNSLMIQSDEQIGFIHDFSNDLACALSSRPAVPQIEAGGEECLSSITVEY